MIEIDGSYGEGGGQILRTSLALSSLIRKPIKITNIRANRPKPGLARQHFIGIKALKEITNADVKGLDIGSTEIEFYPDKIGSGRHRIEIGTAGSITLVLQVLFIPCAFASGKVVLEISGGTDVKWSPPIDYVSKVFLPIAERMGLRAKLELISRGYYPKGNGKVRVEIHPVHSFKALKITERGGLNCVKGVAHSLNLPCHIVERMSRAAKEVLEGYNCDISIQCKKNFSSGCGITLWAEYEKTSLGSGSLGELGKPAEEVGREAGLELLNEIRGKSTVDLHMGDQILPYMALAKGTSEIVVREVTSHLRTNLYIIEKILGNKFKISEVDGEYLIRTKGLGFENESL